MPDMTAAQLDREHAVLIQEMHEWVTAWNDAEESDNPWPDMRGQLTRRQSERIQATLLEALRKHRDVPMTIPEVIDYLVDYYGLWLPTIPDGVRGYLGEMQKLRYRHPTADIESDGSGRSLKTKWTYRGERVSAASPH